MADWGSYGGAAAPNATAYDTAAYDDVSAAAYLDVAAARLALTIVGVLIILVYKARHSVVRLKDQAKAGLPIGRGIGTAVALVRFAVSAPSRGIWIVGHGARPLRCAVGRRTEWQR